MHWSVCIDPSWQKDSGAKTFTTQVAGGASTLRRFHCTYVPMIKGITRSLVSDEGSIALLSTSNFLVQLPGMSTLIKCFTPISPTHHRSLVVPLTGEE